MIKYLKEGRYFYQVNANKIEEIEVKNASYIDGKIYYNDDREQYDLKKVLTRTEDGFKALEDSYLDNIYCIRINGRIYPLNRSCNLFINNDGKVEEHKFSVYRYDLTNRKLISLYYEKEENEQVIVSEDKVFLTYNLAKESRDFEVVKLDGTMEITEGLLSMIRLSKEQQKMVATLKGLLRDMRGMGIEIVAETNGDKMRFFNSRGTSANIGYLYDISENDCYIPLAMLECIEESLLYINEDAEDVLVVERV